MQELDQLAGRMTQFRRALHGFPEPGNGEEATSRFLSRMLSALMPDQLTPMAGTGLRAVFRCARPDARTLAFRADMDGLPIQEETGLDFASRRPGYMHACGHDGHMAVLLGLAAYLSAHRRELPVHVVLLFQPAEETTGGAQRMIAEGCLENPHVDEIYGVHLMPDYPLGVIALSPGPVMAANTEFDLLVSGSPAHGATPHRGVDATNAAVTIYQALQGLMTREVPPMEPAVLTIGRMQSGTVRNILSSQAVLEGILRSYSGPMQTQLAQRIEQVAKGVAASLRVQAEYREHCVYPPVVNDESLVRRALPLIGRRQAQQPQLTAEDFSYYQRERPGAYAFVGTRDERRGQPLHSSRFDFDEAALRVALEFYVNLIQAQTA